MNALVLLTLCTSLITAPMDASAGLENAKTFARIGDWENGIKYLEAYIIQNPTDAEARLLLAECYFNWPDMQTVGERARDKNEDRGEAQIAILANLGDEGFQMLLRGLRSNTREIYGACFSRLGEMKDQRAVNELLKIVEEDTEKKWSAIGTLVAIECDRERPDKRLVDLLMSMVDGPDSELGELAAAARNLAELRVQEALPKMEKGLNRALEAWATLPEKQLADEFLIVLDAIAALSPDDLDRVGGEALDGMSRTQIDALFERARNRLGSFDAETQAFLVRTALTMLETSPGLAQSLVTARRRSETADFLRRLGAVSSGTRRDPRQLGRQPLEVMGRADIKKQLHDLCGSPDTYVRQVALAIIGTNSDEDALPILLPKLRATLLETGYNVPTGREFTARVAPGEQLSRKFLWENADSAAVWKAVKTIASRRTTEFLLDKLRSDDLGWVFTAAVLLEDMGEGRAIERLKRRHSELSDTDAEGIGEVLMVISRAYERLSGQPLAEPEGKAAAGRGGMSSRGRSGGSTGSMRGRMRGGGRGGTTSTTTSTTRSETSEEPEE